MKKYVSVLISLLIFTGCGNGSNSIATDQGNNILDTEIVKKSSDDLTKLSNSEKLAVALKSRRSYESVSENLREDETTFNPNTLQSCEEGGTMEMIMDTESLANGEFPQLMTIIFDDCNQHDEIINGSMKVTQNSEMSGKIEFSENFQVIGNSTFSMIGNGSFTFMEEGEYEVSIINMEMELDGLVHGGQDLIYKSRELIDGGYEEYPISGDEKIGDNAYFSVDSNYDASLTPFVSDRDFNLLRGKFKYTDDKGHQVELEVTRKNEISVKVDDNGDNQFTNNETTIISL